MDVSWDKGRDFTIPWQWGTTGVAVNTKVYGGDINTSDMFPECARRAEGQGQRRARDERYREPCGDGLAGGEPCTEDTELLKKVREMRWCGQAGLDVDGLWRHRKAVEQRLGGQRELERLDHARADGQSGCEIRLSERRLSDLDGFGGAAGRCQECRGGL